MGYIKVLPFAVEPLDASETESVINLISKSLLSESEIHSVKSIIE
jgi:hypothetical protein